MKALTAYDDATDRWALIHGDSFRVLAKLPNDCIDAVVCDPPYAIDFHDEAWDGAAIRRAAGDGVGPAEAFERWTTTWAREARRVLKPGGHLLAFGAPRTVHRLTCGLEDAGLDIRDQLNWMFATGIPKSRRLPGGAGTGLKPGYEPIVLARKRLDGSVQANRERHGTGALNVDAARVGAKRYWPPNVLVSHHPECPAALIDGNSTAPSRIFYSPKASTREREAGCERLPLQTVRIYTGEHHPARTRRNTHVSVKPLGLMRWLIRLATPPNGVVLDPFTGSGSTGAAAMLEDRRFLGIERESDYVTVACARLTHWAAPAAQEEVLP